MAQQITSEERVRIEEFRKAGWSRAEIAKELQRHPTTIGRELQRNGVGDRYSAEVAQARAERRKVERPREKKMDRQPIRDAVENGSIQFWSPDQIDGRQKLTCSERRDRVSPPRSIGGLANIRNDSTGSNSCGVAVERISRENRRNSGRGRSRDARRSSNVAATWATSRGTPSAVNRAAVDCSRWSITARDSRC